MKKYTITKILFMLLNIFIIMTIFFYATQFATFEKYTHLPFWQYMKITTRLYKTFVYNKFILFNWGYTIEGEPIVTEIFPKIITSLKYNVAAFFFYFPLGVGIGLISATYRDSWFDRFVNPIIIFIGSVPAFILTLLYIVFFGYYLKWFPPYYAAIQDTLISNILGYGIPILVLSSSVVFRLARVVRNELIENKNADYYQLARAKGLTRRQAFNKHLFRNSILPVFPELVDVFLITLGGSFIVEITYQIDGVGRLMFDSILKLSPIGTYFVNIDINVTVIIATFYITLASFLMFMVDIISYYIDPRIRLHNNT